MTGDCMLSVQYTSALHYWHSL